MIEVLLCDADGNLFPSEEPAFAASAVVTNRLLGELGVAERFTADELRRAALGRTFRAMATDLARAHGATLDPVSLERWVETERREVVAHLGRVLAPDPAVLAAVDRLAQRMRLAVVSSSAISRLAACFTATGLDGPFPVEARFSAEDSLPVPASKPDPAVYVHAGAALGVTGETAVAVEDAPAGVRSAAGAGFPVVGNLAFVPGAERAEREAELRAAGATAVVASWDELVGLLDPVAAGEALVR